MPATLWSEGPAALYRVWDQMEGRERGRGFLTSWCLKTHLPELHFLSGSIAAVFGQWKYPGPSRVCLAYKTKSYPRYWSQVSMYLPFTVIVTVGIGHRSMWFLY